MFSIATLISFLFLSKYSLSVIPVEDNKLHRFENVVRELHRIEKVVNAFQQQRLEDLKRIEFLENALLLQNRQTRFVLDSTARGHSNVSFTAQLSSDMLGVGIYQTIHFDRVITNNGHAYNPLEGIFCTPATGTYFFIWTATNRGKTFMRTELMKNGVSVSYAASDADNLPDFAVATSFAVLNLAVGDRIWIRSGVWQNGAVAGDNLTSFAGWILD